MAMLPVIALQGMRKRVGASRHHEVMNQRIAIYAGTFDPITKGHLDIIQRALRVVDKLVVGVALDTGKSPLFDLDMRTQMVEEEAAALGENGRIIVAPFQGLLVNFAREHNATLLIRGLRAVSDYEYEFQMANINNKLAPEIETVFLTASESTHFISSRFVKQIARLGGDVSSFVSGRVRERLVQYYA
jgi:pantetheine-phosphate adenylyltransferase